VYGEEAEVRLAGYHQTLHHIMQPLNNVMDDGVLILCGDGKQRLCFPRFATYIADYEEQRQLASILSGYCPKCIIPAFRHGSDDVNPWCEREPHLPRDQHDALRCRAMYEANGDLATLRSFGYHPVTPFSDHNPIPGCSMHNALAPDLLHQVSKNFLDMVHFKVMLVMVAELGVSKEKVRDELDARFTQIPLYPGLKRFGRGISKISRWQGKEYKEMLRIYLGIIRGLVQAPAIRMVKAYLDIQRLSHYDSHTDDEGRETGSRGTLQLLEDAVDEFWDGMMDENGTLMKNSIVPPGWYTMKLHLPRHYADYVREKGSLPQCSTDKSEALHRNVRKAYDASNKGLNCEDSMVKFEGRQTGMRILISELRATGSNAERYKDTSYNDDTDPESDGGADSTDSDDEGRDGTDNSDSDNDGVRALRAARRVDKTRARKERKDRKLVLGVHYLSKMKLFAARELAETERFLGLKDQRLVSETVRTLAWIKGGRQEGMRRSAQMMRLAGVFEIEVTAVYTSMKCVYPKLWDGNLTHEVLRCTDTWAFGRNRHHKGPRRDTVLVRYSGSSNQNYGSTMDGQRIARLWCLFQVDILGGMQLALVQWFDCSGQPEEDTGMFVVTKTQEYEAIELATIERGVHLIPHFGTTLSTPTATAGKPHGLDCYEKFVINNHLDLENFNTFY
jgi:hypothetical protein